MDSVFFLTREARLRFLRSTARSIRCIYICLWTYQPSPSNGLVSMDGWLNTDEENEEEQQQPNSSSGGSAAIHSHLFEAYRKSMCSVDSGCVPGVAYKEGRSYLELKDTDLLNWASAPVQRQFYQEAGIKTAVFMGCKTGEIELGLSTSSNMNTQMNIVSLFSDDNVQSFQLGELVQADCSGRRSSSSSSFPSISAGSPECSSFLLNMAANTSCTPDGVVFQELPTLQQAAIHPSPTHLQPQHMKSQPPYSRLRDTQFPSPTTDVDDAMMRAMLAVLSSSPSSSTSAVNPSPQTHRNRQQSASSCRAKAFSLYSAALVPKMVPSRRNSGSQSMIKTIHSMLRGIENMKVETMMQEASKPTSNQLHHMISERKRREKLNESFQALRSLLPPATKKDKASVLAATKDYLTNLRAQISDLEEKNRALELRFSPTQLAGEDHNALLHSVKIQITKAPQSTPEMQQIVLRVTMGVECDIVDLLLSILECLKRMGSINLVAIDANCYTHRIRQANLTLQIKGTEWDEVAFKEAIERVVDEVSPSRTSPAP